MPKVYYSRMTLNVVFKRKATKGYKLFIRQLLTIVLSDAISYEITHEDIDPPPEV